MSRSNTLSIEEQVASWDDITLKRQQQLLDQQHAALTRQLAAKKLEIESEWNETKAILNDIKVHLSTTTKGGLSDNHKHKLLVALVDATVISLLSI